jgi:hypothetical protein
MNYDDRLRFDALSQWKGVPFENISIPEYSKKNKLMIKQENGRTTIYYVLTLKEIQDTVTNKFLETILERPNEIDSSFFENHIKYKVPNLTASEVEVLFPILEFLNYNLKNPSKSQSHIFWKLLTGYSDLNKLGLEYYKYLTKDGGYNLAKYLGSQGCEHFFDYKRNMWILGE